MNQKNNDSNLYDRRRALRVLGAGVATSGALLVTACKSDGGKAASADKKPAKKVEPTKKAEAGGGACGDPAKLDAASKNLRSTLQYVEASPNEKKCNACLQWVPGPKPEACGGCKLFTGGVAPGGYCLSYVAAKPA